MIPHPKEKPTSVGWQSYPESTEEREDEFIQKRKIAYTITAMILVVCISIISAVVTWLIIRPSPDPPQIPTNRTVTIGNATLVLPVTGLMELTLGIPGKNDTTTVLIGRMLKDNAYTVRGCEDQNSSSCFLIRSGERNYTLLLTYDDYKEEDFSCISVWWTAALDDTLRDCLALGSSRWYGGGLLFHQRWPMKLEKEMTPFKSADIIQIPTDYGSVLEPYWISSEGLGISVNYNARDQPLHTSWNSTGDGSLCIEARFADSPFIMAGMDKLHLDYTVCTAKDVATLHKKMIKNVEPWPKPSGTPSPALFEKPIWSTWVSYKSKLTQQNVLDFMDKINSSGFVASNIEIDDGYQEKYGDFSFIISKFSEPELIFDSAKRRGYNVTFWVYPFVNVEADSFAEGLRDRDFVWTPNAKVPAMTSWWDGTLAALVDFTAPNASDWYFRRLNDFQTKYGIESFKFDAGESNWMPFYRSYHIESVNPDYYGQAYAEAVTKHIGNGLEVRIGLHTQALPIFVRMLDKDSVAGYDNGLRTLIPTALTFGLLGYPFVLPDMVGGNAYRNVTTQGDGGLLENQFPSVRLFLRWLGATVFLPSIQFSIPPWAYGPVSTFDPIETSVKLLAFRQKYLSLILRLAEDSVITGYPIVRPLWWINGDDAVSWDVDDQFLVGDDLMVAPVLDEEADQRNIYVPPGNWHDILQNQNISGPIWLNRYTVKLDEIALFQRWVTP